MGIPRRAQILVLRCPPTSTPRRARRGLLKGVTNDQVDHAGCRPHGSGHGPSVWAAFPHREEPGRHRRRPCHGLDRNRLGRCDRTCRAGRGDRPGSAAAIRSCYGRSFGGARFSSGSVAARGAEGESSCRAAHCVRGTIGAFGRRPVVSPRTRCAGSLYAERHAELTRRRPWGNLALASYRQRWPRAGREAGAANGRVGARSEFARHPSRIGGRSGTTAFRTSRLRNITTSGGIPPALRASSLLE